jgi:hypothetical protein
MDISHNQRDQALFLTFRLAAGRAACARGVGLALKAKDAEVSPAGGEVGFGDFQANHSLTFI